MAKEKLTERQRGEGSGDSKCMNEYVQWLQTQTKKKMITALNAKQNSGFERWH